MLTPLNQHFYYSLKQWLSLKDQHQWVLGAVVASQGSVYRKAGALMLLSDAGHQLGMLSGGCLEKDLLVQARKVCALNTSRHIIYDAQEEGGLAQRLGIGCGGRADIMLLPCNELSNYLNLEQVYKFLQENQACQYSISFQQQSAKVEPAVKDFTKRVCGQTFLGPMEPWTTLVNPRPHLVILGSGVDLIALSQLACDLGWQVSLLDKNLSPQKQALFPKALKCLALDLEQASSEALLSQCDAIIVAHHNLQFDAQALHLISQVNQSQVKYLGLLGPKQRKQQVLDLAQINAEDLPVHLAGPMGLALGGDLPESIALSVLAECHAVLFGSHGRSLNGVYL